MRNLMKGIKKTVNRIFRKKSKKVYSQEPNREKENTELNPGDMIRNLEKNVGEERKQEDIGKKVFERTGHEGVGQSSTVKSQQREGTKIAHGRRKYHKRKGKAGAGKIPQM